MEILISFIIPFIILLTVVVFIHEYGHYYYAKKYGVGVTDFSFLLALVKRYLGLMTNLEQDGNSVQFL